MATKYVQLPAELWLRIIEEYLTPTEKDSGGEPNAWLELRKVNTVFRTGVETVFRETILPQTFIRYEFGEAWDDDDGRIVLDTEFEFTRVSEDKNTAIFKIAEIADEYKAIVADKLKEATTGDHFETPRHTIQICSDLTDGPIPGLSIDFETFELSCDWKEMFTVFWSEVQMTSNITRDWVLNQETWMKGLKAKVQSGQLDMGAMMMEAMSGFANSNQNAAKAARRHRIKLLIQRKYPEMENYKVDEEEEKGILKELGKKRQFYSMMDGFEDEDEDEDEESEENSESEEEWEDEEDDDVNTNDEAHGHDHV